MVLSFPLYARSHRRRTIELTQLQRIGAGQRTMLLSRLVPALLIGSVVAIFAITGNAVLFHRSNPYLGWQGIAHTHAYLYIIVFSVLGAFITTLIPAVAASLYTRLTVNAPIEHIHNPSAMEGGFRSKNRSHASYLVLTVAGPTLILAAFALMFVSATTLGPGCRSPEIECSYAPLGITTAVGASLRWGFPSHWRISHDTHSYSRYRAAIPRQVATPKVCRPGTRGPPHRDCTLGFTLGSPYDNRRCL